MIALWGNCPTGVIILGGGGVVLVGNTEFLNCATRGILEGLNLVPGLFQGSQSGQTPLLFTIDYPLK